MASSEIINVFNDSGEIIDTLTREEAESDNHITENVLVFVFNSLGKVWVQLRPQSKKHYPGLWDISACGGVLSGETHAESAHRETIEETGIDTELSYVKSFMNVFPGDDGETRRRLSHVYIGISDEKPEVNDEVDEFKLWSPSELRHDVVQNESRYIPSFVTELDIAVEAYERLSKESFND